VSELFSDVIVVGGLIAVWIVLSMKVALWCVQQLRDAQDEEQAARDGRGRVHD
jgi:hypothetical protein